MFFRVSFSVFVLNFVSISVFYFVVCCLVLRCFVSFSSAFVLFSLVLFCLYFILLVSSLVLFCLVFFCFYFVLFCLVSSRFILFFCSVLFCSVLFCSVLICSRGSKYEIKGFKSRSVCE